MLHARLRPLESKDTGSVLVKSRLVTATCPWSDGLSVLNFLRKAPLFFHRFDPTRSPSTRFKWIAEILRFPRNLAALELHDADRIGRLPVVQNYIFGNP